jgi:hypothetical protein
MIYSGAMKRYAAGMTTPRGHQTILFLTKILHDQTRLAVMMAYPADFKMIS